MDGTRLMLLVLSVHQSTWDAEIGPGCSGKHVSDLFTVEEGNPIACLRHEKPACYSSKRHLKDTNNVSEMVVQQ
ncbi:hypothetical protein B0O80DRAFT_444329 [Mortierella sp. GBAus27b]|nr:hypothetical protein B0O80DRAFT_444329 [Mortierella sp. GBAus27b]